MPRLGRPTILDAPFALNGIEPTALQCYKSQQQRSADGMHRRTQQAALANKPEVKVQRIDDNASRTHCRKLVGPMIAVERGATLSMPSSFAFNITM